MEKKGIMKILLLLSMAGLFICSCNGEKIEVEGGVTVITHIGGLDLVPNLKQFEAQCDCNYEIQSPNNVKNLTFFERQGDTADEAIDQAIASCSKGSRAQYKPAPSAENCQLFERAPNQKEFRSICKCKISESVEARGNTVDEAITEALTQAKANPHCSQTTKSDCTVDTRVFYKLIKK